MEPSVINIRNRTVFCHTHYCGTAISCPLFTVIISRFSLSLPLLCQSPLVSRRITLESVMTFKYLPSIICGDCSSSKEIKARRNQSKNCALFSRRCPRYSSSLSMFNSQIPLLSKYLGLNCIYLIHRILAKCAKMMLIDGCRVSA